MVLGNVKRMKEMEIANIVTVVLLAVFMRRLSLCPEETLDVAAVLATEVVEAAFSKDLIMMTSHTRRMTEGMKLIKDMFSHPLMC